MASACTPFMTSGPFNCANALTSLKRIPPRNPCDGGRLCSQRSSKAMIRCSAETNNSNLALKTCRNCKKQFDPLQNHPRACSYHTAHFGGETRRKFESVYTGGTMSTPDGGKISQYWHCCGSEDPFDLGCVAAPHSSYDD